MDTPYLDELLLLPDSQDRPDCRHELLELKKENESLLKDKKLLLDLVLNNLELFKSINDLICGLRIDISSMVRIAANQITEES